MASAAVSLNCGPGTFGLLYMNRTDKEYHLSSLIPESQESDDNEGKIVPDTDAGTRRNVDKKTEADTITKQEYIWYEALEGINGEEGIKYSGSEEAYLSLLKIFNESIPEKSAEINGYFENEDWQDYTIKVHALKSSAKLIGATGFAEEAQALENAGKTQDIDYIRNNHSLFMEKYLRFEEILSPLFKKEDTEADKPTADKEILESFCEVLKEAAEKMDCNMIDEALGEISDYAIKKEDATLFGHLRDCAEKYDYDGILRIIKEKGM